jgi:RNA polymerase sigma-70 factor (ECF subfamily)
LENYYRQQIRDRSESLLVQELEDKIETAIQSLPEACKRVFILSRKKNLKNKEIADLLEIDIKTVEKHITKALTVLRANLKEYL